MILSTFLIDAKKREWSSRVIITMLLKSEALFKGMEEEIFANCIESLQIIVKWKIIECYQTNCKIISLAKKYKRNGRKCRNGSCNLPPNSEAMQNEQTQPYETLQNTHSIFARSAFDGPYLKKQTVDVTNLGLSEP